MIYDTEQKDFFKITVVFIQILKCKIHVYLQRSKSMYFDGDYNIYMEAFVV